MLRLWDHIANRWPMAAAGSLTDDDDSDDSDGLACFAQPPENTTDRIVFGRYGAVIYGYPSTGGVLVKEADPVDMQFLSLSCLGSCARTTDAATEDQFCRQMLQVGATFWPSRRSRVRLFEEDVPEEQSKIMVYGWPSDGRGVWILSYDHEDQLPDDFGRISLVTSMEAKIEVMKSLNATFVDDSSQIKELDLAQLPKLLPLTIVHIRDWRGPLFIAK